ncbi:hypothetical protein [Enterococcus avium]
MKTVKEDADHVYPSNEEDGALVTMDQLFLVITIIIDFRSF